MIYTGQQQNWVQSRGGIVIPESSAMECGVKLPTAGDFFAGAGGFSLGIIQAGFRVVFAVEWDVNAVVTYMTNLCRWGQVQIHFVEESDRERMEKFLASSFKKGPGIFAGQGWISSQPESVPGVEHIIVGDVRKLTGAQILEWIGMERGELDLVVGGPPCQGFSTAGQQNIADPRNNLVFEFGRFICELHPRAICMEEVPAIVDMVTPEGVPVLDELAWILERGDYTGHLAMQRALKGQFGFTLGRQKMRAKSAETETDESDTEESGPEQFEFNLGGAFA